MVTLPQGGMVIQYSPYQPLNVPKPFSESVWIVDGPEIRMKAGPLRLPFPTRMTIVRLGEGQLWIHSPTQPSKLLFDAVDALGTVAYLIAPNSLHYWWIPEWMARYPQAKMFAPTALKKSARRRLPDYQPLTDTPPAGWASEIDQVAITGRHLAEVDFYHPTSRTLIVTDIVQNLEVSRIRSAFYRTVFRAGGAVHPHATTPLDLRLDLRRERAAVRRAAEKMLAWHPARLILAHGRCVNVGAAAELRLAFRWVL
jgi:hypothetical protein